MIAIITSCISPIQQTEAKSFFSLEEREYQTLFSLEKLKEAGFEKFLFVDNSATYDYSKLHHLLSPLQIIHLLQYQFENKGINELLMLLAIVDQLPENEPIFKISGRYYPNQEFNLKFDLKFDFTVKAYNFQSKRGTISTRGYFVRNKDIYKDFLLKTLTEVYVYQQRIVGFRSLLDQFISIFKPRFNKPPTIAIEFAAARVLKNQSYKVQFLETLGLEGQVAGFKDLPKIKE